MKTIEYVILTVILSLVVFQTSAAAQTPNPTLYVIVQHTDDSPAYNANYDRIQQDIMSRYTKNTKVVFISYDVTNDAMTANLKGDFDWYAVYNAAYANNGEEGIIIMDPASKQVISRYNLDAGTKDILKSIAEGSQMIARSNQ
ncbi:MAG: hypothetical protein JST55_14030 [Bacteroidetes bacterium]|nr:hypothetical protein [Bacteroidota bacterium]